AIISNIPMLLQAGVQIILAIGNGIVTAIPLILEAIPVLFSSIWDAVSGINWIDLGKNLIESVGNGIISGFEKIKSAVADFFGGIWDFITGEGSGGAEEAGGKIPENYAKGIENGTPQIQSSVQQMTSSATQGIVSDASLFQMAGMEMGQSYSLGIDSSTGIVTSSILNLSDAASSSVSILDFSAQGYDSGLSLGAGIDSSSGAVAASMEQLMASIPEGVSMPDISKLGIQAGDSVANGINSSTGNAVSAAQSLSSQVQSAAETEVNVKINTDATSLESFKTGISEVASSASADIQKVPEAFDSAFSQAFSTASSQTAAITGTVQSGMSSLTSAVQSGCSQALSSAQSCASSIYSAFAGVDLYGAGVNMMSGLVNGIQSMAGAVQAAAASIAASAAAAVNSALKIHSPSRVLTQSGEYAGEGLVVGLKNRTEQVAESAKRYLASPIVNNATPDTDNLKSPVIKDIIELFGGTWPNPKSGGGTSGSPTIVYSPTHNFYGDAPSKEEIVKAERISQAEFEGMMERYIKTKGRLALG
ncbi:MAG: hypothetical protein Q4C52_12015, partial [Eubacteriales bacterium]|nr:hypothetical protein [Eubacteriales bacterium]